MIYKIDPNYVKKCHKHLTNEELTKRIALYKKQLKELEYGK